LGQARLQTQKKYRRAEEGPFFFLNVRGFLVFFATLETEIRKIEI
jgi:hypothetical protein